MFIDPFILKSTSNKHHIAVLMPKKLAIYEMIGNFVLLKFIYFI